MMNKTLLALGLASLLLLSCGPAAQSTENSKTELVVHYNGQEELRKNSRYISEAHLRSLLENDKNTIIIFAADWCAACKLTRQAIVSSKFKVRVYYVNIDEPWAMKLAKIMNIRSIPLMFHVGKSGKTLAVRVGPSQIISYMALKY